MIERIVSDKIFFKSINAQNFNDTKTFHRANEQVEMDCYVLLLLEQWL